MDTQIRVSMRGVRTSFWEPFAQTDYIGDFLTRPAATQASLFIFILFITI